LNQFDANYADMAGKGAYRISDTAYQNLVAKKFKGATPDTTLNGSNSFKAAASVTNTSSGLVAGGFFVIAIDDSVIDDNKDGIPDPDQPNLPREIFVTALGSGISSTTVTVLQTRMGSKDD
jgi:hypothetical protein